MGGRETTTMVVTVRKLLTQPAVEAGGRPVSWWYRENNAGNDKVQFSSVQFNPLNDWVVREDMRGASAEICSSLFLREAIVSSVGVSRDIHSFTISIQHFFCRPQRSPLSKVP